MPTSEPPAPTPSAVGLLERLRHLQRKQAIALFWELLRFTWVGVLTVGLYAFEMWALGQLNDWPPWLNAALAYGPCLVVNYTLHRSFTFKSDKRHPVAGPRYLAVQLSGLAFNSSALWLTVEVLRWPYLPSQVVVTALLASCSYLAQKVWSFG